MSKQTELRTERLLLRPFKLEDVDDVLAYASDPEWARFLPLSQPYTRRDAEEFVARSLLESWETHPTFATVLAASVIGGINLRVDAVNDTGELGYGLARSHWGKGLAAEAAQAVIDWAFQSYGLAKIFARADIRNERSWHLMEKLGMTREGLLRKHVRSNVPSGGRIDDVYYGLLRHEWEQCRVCCGPSPGGHHGH